mmetsp:Transcript_10091/g.29930  ORF Transcript_10091/g.29930 Transcript_10091/m.29930 type:complete len:303 (-) Transcript_10091:1523-2431(-)
MAARSLLRRLWVAAPVAARPLWAPVAAPRAWLSAAPALGELTLNSLVNPNKKTKRRKGRGIGSSKGKTAGRGHKGTYARSGGSVRVGFEGGQTPMYRRLPKVGFNNKNAEFKPQQLDVGVLQDWVTMGRLRVPEGRMITMKELCDAGVVNRTKVLKKGGVVLLARGADRLRMPLHVEVSKASAAAIEAVEAAGGTVTVAHFNKLALRALIKPHKFPILPKRAFPSLKEIPRFLDSSRRGYLSPEVQFRNRALFGAATSEDRLRLEHDKTRETDELLKRAAEDLAKRKEEAFLAERRAAETSS